MSHKPTTPEVAERVLEARELARAGSSTALIERLTGFGPRFVRKLVREHGGALACKPRDPKRWLRDRQRQAHLCCVVYMYELQKVTRSQPSRLLDTFWSYRNLVSVPVLGVNECAQIVELYESGNLWERRCTQCSLTYFVISEHPLCPVCRLKARELCRVCGMQKKSSRAGVHAQLDTCSCGSVPITKRDTGAEPILTRHAPGPSDVSHVEGNCELAVAVVAGA